MGCPDANCCCDGCSTKPRDPMIAAGLPQPIQKRCCKCVPRVICVSASDDGGSNWRTQFAQIQCIEDDREEGEDPLLYFCTVPITDELRLINVRYHVGEPDSGCCANQPLDRTFGTSGFPSAPLRLGTSGAGLSDPDWRSDFNDVFLTFTPQMVYQADDSDPDTGQCYWLWTDQGTGGDAGLTFNVVMNLKVEQPDPDVAEYNFLLSYEIAISGDPNIPGINGSNTFHYELNGWEPVDGTPRLNRVEATGQGFYGSGGDHITFPNWIEISWDEGTPCVDGDTQCWLTWDIPALGASGERLIDHEEIHDPGEDCSDPCQEKTEACCDFGGEWIDVPADTGPDVSIRISKAPMIPLDEMRCGCCSCICKCACVSVYVRDYSEVGGGTYTGTTNSVNRCAELEIVQETVCDGDVTLPKSASVRWEDAGSGFVVALRGKEPSVISSTTITTGTEVTPTCEITNLLTALDHQVHEITPDGSGDAVVEYTIDTKTSVAATRLAWAGWSEGEDSTVVIAVWDWTMSSWVDQSAVPIAGRPVGLNKVRYVNYNTTSAYTGTGGNEGLIKVRVTAANATRLVTDLLKSRTPDSCKLYLEMPDTVSDNVAGTTDPYPLTEFNDCPVPIRGAQWAFTDFDNEKDYIVYWECSTCNESCGSLGIGGCCGGLPLPSILTAEVAITCVTGCTGSVIVPLIRPFAGGEWEGSASYCGGTINVHLTCTGDNEWTVNVTGIGSCSFEQTIDGGDCPPLDLEFSGNYATGIGCCGAGTIVTTAPITVTIVE